MPRVGDMIMTEDRNLVLEYSDVEIALDEHILFTGLNFSLAQGEYAYLTGQVGAGKSVLMKTIYAELPIQGAVAKVLDYNLSKITPAKVQALRRSLGIIFQDFLLLPRCTAYENLDVVLRACSVKNKAERRERIEEALELVGLQNKGYKYPHELSGGEQQRVAIARAILSRPKMILADEPTANLDLDSGLEITELLHRIGQEYGAAVLMATHNMTMIEEYPATVYEVRGGCLGLKP